VTLPAGAPAPVLDGIDAGTVDSARLSTRVLFSGPENGEPVLFLHGNLSSATWWEETMLALPAGYRGIAPDQRGYGDADPAARVDATRGMGDYVDDAVALLDALGIDRAHLVGNSLGGVVVWRLMASAPDRFRTVTQVAPGSPYGFGGTGDVAGTPIYEDFAGSGGGLVNPELVTRMTAADDSTESPFAPRNALRMLVYKPPFIPPREDVLVAALLKTHLGEDAYPGDVVVSTNWPFVSPGVDGANNALSPKYMGDPEDIVSCDPKPPVLWVRGADDLAVSDTAAGDPGTWGPMGLVPGYPGPEAYPQQPMIGQTRAVLERYAAAGGSYAEVVIDDCGHVPFIEKPEEFNRVFHGHLTNQGNNPTGGTK
jgi:pimeloyl-ACP methyl ester carboxylesterase